MTRFLAACLVGAIATVVLQPARARAQDTSDLTGRWTLNTQLSEAPRELGFGVDWLSTRDSAPDTNAGGRGGRGRRGSTGVGTGPFTAHPESADDAKRAQRLTAEVRKPSPHLTIADTQTAVTITDEEGQARTFHPDGRKDVLQLDGVPVGVTAKRDGGRLVILYSVEQGRELRYTYSRAATPSQLVVDVQFVERGGGDHVRRIYEPTRAVETVAPVAADAGKTLVPAAADRPAPQAFNQQPDAELKGLKTLGVVVEDLSSQAAACGLNQSTLETAASTRLSEAGFTVRRNSDEDTYVYVNVITSSLSTGLCVSRYDVFLYTHATAKLSYQDTPVLVQVSLMHRGGIAGGAPSAHAEGVLRGVREYVDQFSNRIRAASK